MSSDDGGQPRETYDDADGAGGVVVVPVLVQVVAGGCRGTNSSVCNKNFYSTAAEGCMANGQEEDGADAQPLAFNCP
jgi:hypothetical protein